MAREPSRAGSRAKVEPLSPAHAMDEPSLVSSASIISVPSNRLEAMVRVEKQHAIMEYGSKQPW
jgi:hypothetical protein